MAKGGFPGGFGGGNMNNLMKQAQKLQKDMEDMQKDLENKEFEASVGGGAVVVKVNGKKEINLGNWYLKAGETKFILSPDTIINSNGVIFLSSLDSKIAPNANEVILFNPSGSKVAIIQENKIESKEISKEQKGENNIENILGIRVKDAEDIIEQYKKYSVIKDDVESANEEKTIEDEEEITNNIATVGSTGISTSSEKMIIKIVKMPLTLIKAIGKAFYNF